MQIWILSRVRRSMAADRVMVITKSVQQSEQYRTRILLATGQKTLEHAIEP